MENVEVKKLQPCTCLDNECCPNLAPGFACKKRADTERFDALERLVAQGDCPGIINDDKGHWAVTGVGMQSIQPGPGPDDVETSFFVEAGQWRNSLREAIDEYLAASAEDA